MFAQLKTPIIVTLIALILLLISVAIGWRFERGDGSLLRNVFFTSTSISPNADGDNDLLTIAYEISHNAQVSIYFDSETGDRYYFRRSNSRGADEYQVQFSGIVEGYRLPDETIAGEIIERLLQNGRYTWTVEAVDEAGLVENVSGELEIENAGISLPELRAFSLDKQTFTPNRDGIDDRVLIQFMLTKNAQTDVYLQLPNGARIPIAEKERDVEIGAPGRHYFDYEGGVDNGETPPPDGSYPIIGFAEDAEGQKIRVEDELEIKFGGVPRADIVAPAIGDQVEFNLTAVPLCETLFFTMTVSNYGNTPIRTTGPAPGSVYDSDWNYNTVGYSTQSGAWRVAIGYDDEISNYPFRWAVGEEADLTKIGDYFYLMPGDRAVVTGGIRIVGSMGAHNPEVMWAGLIHEDVEISQFNNRVNPKAITLDLPDANHFTPCPKREP